MSIAHGRTDPPSTDRPTNQPPPTTTSISQPTDGRRGLVKRVGRIGLGRLPDTGALAPPLPNRQRAVTGTINSVVLAASAPHCSN